MDELKEKSLEGSEEPEKEPEANLKPAEEEEQKGSFGDFLVRLPSNTQIEPHNDILYRESFALRTVLAVRSTHLLPLDQSPQVQLFL